jgi:uncharacterized protein with PIN domain
VADYLDTSAFIKLVRSELESRALRAEIATSDALVSSALLLVARGGEPPLATVRSRWIERARPWAR